MSTTHALCPTRLHSLDGDLDDLGYWTRGHYSEVEMRAEVSERYPEDDRHPCAAAPEKCTYFMGWWRRVPTPDGARFMKAAPNSRGAFRVTALLTPEAEF